MTERTEFQAWITKYALTGGISTVKVEDCFNISTSMVTDRVTRRCYHKGDWHRDKSDAITRAEQMRVAKIASLQKQIAKLQKLTF